MKYVRYRYALLSMDKTSYKELIQEYKRLFGEIAFYKSGLKHFQVGNSRYIIIRIDSRHIDKLVYTIKSLEHRSEVNIGPIYIGNTLKSVKSRLNDLFNIEN